MFILFLLIPFSGYSQDERMTLKVAGEDAFVTSPHGGCVFGYHFRKCMYNELYTFYRVTLTTDSLKNEIVNEASSDNIGPFLIKGGGWTGGNHIYKDNKTRTAETVSVEIFADGNPVKSDTVQQADNISFKVRNVLFNPLGVYVGDRKQVEFTDTLCYEYAEYQVKGNSVQVKVEHEYINEIPVTVSRYYGMQSVFRYERYILTPRGEYKSWTPVKNVSRFRKGSYPYCNRFVEKSRVCAQSAYLFGRGLGMRNELPDGDDIFIGNSWTKSYHKLIGNAPRKAGDSDFWEGVYTWTSKPLTDADGVYAYDGYIDGRHAVYFSNVKKGSYAVELPEWCKNKEFKIIENTSDAVIRCENGLLETDCRKGGSIIMIFK